MRRYLKAKSAQFEHLIGHRGHRVMKTGSWALIAKACAAVNLFVCVPFVLDSLGQRQFGAWAAIASLVTIGNFLDFGLGNGAMNLIASAKGREALDEVAAIVRTAYVSLLKITLLLSASLCILPFVSWYRLLGLSENEAGISTASVAVVAVAILTSIPLGIANKIHLGLGQGGRAFRWQALGQALTTIGVIALAKLSAPLPTIVAGTALLPLITLLFNTIELHRALPAKNQPHPANAEIARQIRKEGLLFFTLQLCAALAFNFDLLLVSSLAGAEKAAEYSIVQRAFSVIPLSLGLIWVSLWPTYREALAKGNRCWVFVTFRNSLALACGYAATLGTLIALTFEPLSRLWLGHSLHLSPALIWGFALWHLLESAGTGISILLNAASIVRHQVLLGISFALPCFALKVVAIKQLGMEMLPWTTIICYFFLSLLPLTFLRASIGKLIADKQY
jgi:O-antigen/teichoic acid export membrane protein